MLFCALKKNKIIALVETFFIENNAFLICFLQTYGHLLWELEAFIYLFIHFGRGRVSPTVGRIFKLSLDATFTTLFTTAREGEEYFTFHQWLSYNAHIVYFSRDFISDTFSKLQLCLVAERKSSVSVSFCMFYMNIMQLPSRISVQERCQTADSFETNSRKSFQEVNFL